MSCIFKHEIEYLRDSLEPGMSVKFNRGYDNYGKPIIIEGMIEKCYPRIFFVHGWLEAFTYVDLYLGRKWLEREKNDGNH